MRKHPMPPICIDCGSPELKSVKRDIVFTKSNPGEIRIPSKKCIECQNCGQQFIGEDVSLKIRKKK